MSINTPLVYEESNLSHAWGRAFLHVIESAKHRLSPLSISVTGFENDLPNEDFEIRNALDSLLAQKKNKFSSKVTALTIFPNDAWVRRGMVPVDQFSVWYLRDFFPRLQARDRHNHRGTYFERMIRFRGIKYDEHGTAISADVNQLAHLIKIWRRDRSIGSSSRHSALQVSIFDPVKDHTGSKMLGFPCLQQVSFSYEGNQLAINAYYPTQYIMDRAYGNYLGLCHLGRFMAQDMKLKLVRLNCFVGLPEIGNDWTKRDLTDFADLIRSRLP